MLIFVILQNWRKWQKDICRSVQNTQFQKIIYSIFHKAGPEFSLACGYFVGGGCVC